MSERIPPLRFVRTHTDLFIIRDGKRIAKRGRPGTPEARTWVSLVPGIKVYDDDDEIVVEEDWQQ